MKDKEPDNLFFSADESPVPLPSVEEAWSDMRKKLDEEMPERALLFTWKRTGMLSILLLLAIGAFWFIERRGAGEGAVRKGQQQRTGAGVKTEKPAADRTKGKADEGKKERTTDEGKTENTPAEQLNAKTDEGQTEKAIEREQRQNAANGQHGKIGGIGMKRKGTDHREAGKPDRQQARPTGNRRPTVNGRQIKIVVVADLAGPRRDPILIWVNMPKRVGVITRTPSGKEKKNADQPDKTKKVVPVDSTRILWAAGLQDSKSFPVGAQQPVDYNANLKKDIWFDYVPAPYFQYFISRKIGFQVALQFNNPQYTEAVSIFKKKGTVTGFYSNDTDIVVRKLYYLSLPLTVYYSPFRNFSLGAGLQFSNLSNGVAFQNKVIHYVGAGIGQPDTVTGIKLISLKEYRPAYSNLKKTDWRALFEMNYYWKRVTLGVQYQQGLSDYLYTPVDGSAGKDKNSSFNVYLRCNLWERRIRIGTR